MRKLFLHVGTHKTGTTSFQAYLADHREQLAGQGVAVCMERQRNAGLIANCFSLPNAILRPSLMTMARMSKTAKRPSFMQFAKALAHVGRFLADKTAKRFVLSAEGFCFARENEELARLRKLLRASELEIVPVVCFRDEWSWRESWLHQVESHNSAYRMPHGEGNGDIRGDWVFDRAQILGFWQQLGQVRSVDFDQAVDTRGTVVPALLEAIEVEPCGGFEPYFLNARG